MENDCRGNPQEHLTALPCICHSVGFYLELDIRLDRVVQYLDELEKKLRKKDEERSGGGETEECGCLTYLLYTSGGNLANSQIRMTSVVEISSGIQRYLTETDFDKKNSHLLILPGIF